MAPPLSNKCKKAFGTNNLYKIFKITNGTDLSLETLHKAWKTQCLKWHSDKYATQTAQIQADARNKYNLIEEIYKKLKEEHFPDETEDNNEEENDSINVNELKAWKNETEYEMELAKKETLNLRAMLEASREMVNELEDKVKELKDEIKQSGASHKKESVALKELFDTRFAKMKKMIENLQAEKKFVNEKNNNQHLENSSSDDHSGNEDHEDLVNDDIVDHFDNTFDADGGIEVHQNYVPLFSNDQSIFSDVEDHSRIGVHQERNNIPADHPNTIHQGPSDSYVRQGRKRRVVPSINITHSKKKSKRLIQKNVHNESATNNVERKNKADSAEKNAKQNIQSLRSKHSSRLPHRVSNESTNKVKITDFIKQSTKSIYGKSRSKVVVFDKNNRNLCYIFYYQRRDNNYRCDRCSKYKKEKKYLTGKLKIDEEGKEYFWTTNVHACKPVLYIPEISEML